MDTHITVLQVAAIHHQEASQEVIPREASPVATHRVDSQVDHQQEDSQVAQVTSEAQASDHQDSADLQLEVSAVHQAVSVDHQEQASEEVC